MSENLIKLLSTWLPFIILIAIWIFFMMRMRAGSPFQKKLLDNTDTQLEVQRDIARNLDRIASALEQRQP